MLDGRFALQLETAWRDQHVAEATTQFIYLNETRSMGAALLPVRYAPGPRKLPCVVNRQYNLIVIDDALR